MKPSLIPFLIILSSLSLNTHANAANGVTEESPSGRVQRSNPLNTHAPAWAGIGRLQNSRYSYCSATLIDTRTTEASSANSPAYIITSQHCFNTDHTDKYSYFGGIQRDIPTRGKVHFNKFEDTRELIKSYTLKKIAWQSDRGFDLAIIELDKPLAHLINAGIEPLKIALETPPTGTAITALGIPKKSHLHATHCTQLPFVSVASHPWVGTGLLANKCTDLTPGARGGPVLDKTTNELVSVMVATSHGANANEKCLSLSPCELKDDQSQWNPNTYYTRPVSFLNHCFTDGTFTPDSNRCELKKLPSLWVKNGHYPAARILEKTTAGPDTHHDTVDIALSLKTPFYRYHYTHDINSCLSEDQYSQSISSNEGRLKFTLDDATGMHYACVIGVSSEEAPPPTNVYTSAKIIAIERFEATAQLNPDITIERESKNSDLFYVSFKHVSPFFEHFTVKAGDYATTDCSSAEGYAAIFPADFDGNRLTYDTNPNFLEITYQGHLRVPRIRTSDAPWFGQTITREFTAKEQAIKVCAISYNREKVPMAAQTYILKPL